MSSCTKMKPAAKWPSSLLALGRVSDSAEVAVDLWQAAAELQHWLTSHHCSSPRNGRFLISALRLQLLISCALAALLLPFLPFLKHILEGRTGFIISSVMRFSRMTAQSLTLYAFNLCVVARAFVPHFSASPRRVFSQNHLCPMRGVRSFRVSPATATTGSSACDADATSLTAFNLTEARIAGVQRRRRTGVLEGEKHANHLRCEYSVEAHQLTATHHSLSILDEIVIFHVNFCLTGLSCVVCSNPLRGRPWRVEPLRQVSRHKLTRGDAVDYQGNSTFCEFAKVVCELDGECTPTVMPHTRTTHTFCIVSHACRNAFSFPLLSTCSSSTYVDHDYRPYMCRCM